MKFAVFFSLLGFFHTIMGGGEEKQLKNRKKVIVRTKNARAVDAVALSQTLSVDKE